AQQVRARARARRPRIPCGPYVYESKAEQRVYTSRENVTCVTLPGAGWWTGDGRHPRACMSVCQDIARMSGHSTEARPCMDIRVSAQTCIVRGTEHRCAYPHGHGRPPL